MIYQRYLYTFLILFLFLSLSPAAIVDTVSITSPKMNNSFRAIVVLPDNYGEVNLPVVYLLHGWSGNYRDWYDKTDLAPLSDQFQMIIVCPDGGYASWYLDSPVKSKSQYESYIVYDVVNYIDQNYQTISNSDGRILCGLSMGGHGALSLLCKYPNRFAAAGSMSGVMELTSSKDKYGISDLLGSYESNKKHWEEYSCLGLVDLLVGKNKGVLLDCGISDIFIKGTRLVHKKLLELNISHDYIERPGGHSWTYWDNALEYHLLFFQKWLENNKN